MLELKTPFRLIISGCSDAGKSTILAKMISYKNKMFHPPIEKIIYCAKHSSSVPPILLNDDSVTFHEGIPSEDDINDEEGQNILYCFDDLIGEVFDSPLVSNLYTTGRNRGISVAICTQNLLPKYRRSRDISLNTNYYIIFRNIRDASQISHFARQVYPDDVRAFSDMMKNGINSETNDRGYLFCNFSPDVSDLLRFQTNIFDERAITFVHDDKVKELQKTFTHDEIHGISR